VNDLIDELQRMHRAVSDGEREELAHVVELRRSYEADPEDVWSACTSPERLPRWFLPVAGELRPGGRFQLEGHAGGEILDCEPPSRLVVTWESGKQSSLVTLELSAAGDGTELVLRHAVPDDEHWADYGPGAVGVGWDLALLALGRELAGAPLDSERFAASAEAGEVMRLSAAAWGAAHAAAGVGTEVAAGAAGRTTAAYVPEPEG
jgi:uncharacterized protein YndB with AHSA1/START domain